MNEFSMDGKGIGAGWTFPVSAVISQINVCFRWRGAVWNSASVSANRRKAIFRGCFGDL